MGRTVVLRHDLPDGTHHFDWLVEPFRIEPSPGEAPGAADDAVLIAWRLAERVDHPGAGSLRAERLAPHRRAYLTYEGPVSKGRGQVTRVAAGWAEVRRDSPAGFEAVADFGAGPVRVLGASTPGGDWELRVEHRI
ncbi:MAG TPA: hypothetical protein VFF69_10895 [Phycisphaerales bacterium]|nr:hypothetical protein [Phycisphaerales bacterium]